MDTLPFCCQQLFCFMTYLKKFFESDEIIFVVNIILQHIKYRKSFQLNYRRILQARKIRLINYKKIFRSLLPITR